MGLLSKLKSWMSPDSPFFSGKVAPTSILFTTPTLNDALPQMSLRDSTSDCCFIHEDDWRQFEFVSPNHDAEIRQELQAIDHIWREKSVPFGEHTAFQQVHVRQLIRRPLDIQFSVEDFERLLGKTTVPMSVDDWPHAFQDVHAGPLESGFAYSLIESNRLITLGLDSSHQLTLGSDVADRLERLISEHNLRLVHWRSRSLFDSTDSIMRYLRGTGA